MNEAKYPSKERVERDGVLLYAEGDELLGDPDEARRQGYTVDDAATATVAWPSKERVIRDDVLVYSIGDDLAGDLDEARRQGYDVEPAPAKAPVAKKAAAAKKAAPK